MKKVTLGVIALLAIFSLSLMAKEQIHHKVVIQVSSDDPQVQTIALNNAVNIQKLYGMDNVDVEVVAYGPGLSLLTKENKLSDRIASLAMSDIAFSACSNTITKIKNKTGKEPILTSGVVKVDAGVGRIIELQEEGYAYMRP